MAINFLSSIDIAGTASLSSVSNDNSSYTGILVWDGGLLKYRTKLSKWETYMIYKQVQI